MDKRQKRNMLYELEHLTQTNGDKNRIAELREQLGMNVEEKEEMYNFDEVQFFRMKALRLTDAEMAFLTSSNASDIRRFKKQYTKEELKKEIERYENYSAVRGSKRARQLNSE